MEELVDTAALNEFIFNMFQNSFNQFSDLVSQQICIYKEILIFLYKGIKFSNENSSFLICSNYNKDNDDLKRTMRQMAQSFLCISCKTVIIHSKFKYEEQTQMHKTASHNIYWLFISVEKFVVWHCACTCTEWIKCIQTFNFPFFKFLTFKLNHLPVAIALF